MVNYCCVNGCLRNSRINKHLNYFKLPKERHRQLQWLKMAGREDLKLKDENKVKNLRFCSRHFAPDTIRNRLLAPTAIPTLYLSGDHEEKGEPQTTELNPETHNGIACNSCNGAIVGYRYKCVSCTDYDLCQKCEMLEIHSEHFMIRMPRPVKLEMENHWRKTFPLLFSCEEFDSNPNSSYDQYKSVFESESSDDEPITKYKNYDSGVDLSEDVKCKIRKEVSRVLKIKVDRTDRKKAKKKVEKRKGEVKTEERSSKRLKVAEEKVSVVKADMTPVETVVLSPPPTLAAPEVVFADVNNIQSDMKTEIAANSLPAALHGELESLVPGAGAGGPPLMHVKLSDDLTELMIEVTNADNQKTVYKYS